ncbi:uncharacterized protein LOC132507034 [Lagenorhynchus albirostris]|uniref:uncharacterized protein LOC132507034 n=1 Tax=Lagenorhynchus albirostris TaxID=27610 RepID=UPI0028E256F2|nr:uncharacterized protein LOC132507034 [Lagenorhynchus albirostris]
MCEAQGSGSALIMTVSKGTGFVEQISFRGKNRNCSLCHHCLFHIIAVNPQKGSFNTNLGTVKTNQSCRQIEHLCGQQNSNPRMSCRRPLHLGLGPGLLAPSPELPGAHCGLHGNKNGISVTTMDLKAVTDGTLRHKDRGLIPYSNGEHAETQRLGNGKPNLLVNGKPRIWTQVCLNLRPSIIPLDHQAPLPPFLKKYSPFFYSQLTEG